MVCCVLLDMLVKAANQDGHYRTPDWLPMRRPRILLVNSPYMGGLRGTSLESHHGGWLTMGFSQVGCFHNPYRFWDLPGEDSSRGKHAKHGKHDNDAKHAKDAKDDNGAEDAKHAKDDNGAEDAKDAKDDNDTDN